MSLTGAPWKSAGVAALLVASEPPFLALKLAGAAYLIFLGAQALSEASAAEVRGAADDIFALGEFKHLLAILSGPAEPLPEDPEKILVQRLNLFF